MSRITNVILHYNILDKDKLEEVNAFFDDVPGLVSINDDKVPRGWYGGDKIMTPMAIGAFNYLQLYNLLDHLITIEWKFPEAVQLMAKGEDDEKFKVYDVLGDKEEHRTCVERALAKFADSMMSNQQDLDPDMKEVIYNNLWDLYT